MDRIADHLHPMVPALLFLCTGVPLAALLDRLGFFDAVAIAVDRRSERIPIAALWWLAAATTAVLNLDTTVVLLTPLFVRLARRSGTDPFPVAIIPLLLASFASSVLPVSNLTTLIATDRFGLTVEEVFTHLAPVSAAASVAGWVAYRRRYPRALPAAEPAPLDRRALVVGSVVVAGLLVGFVFGPLWSISPWLVALAADAVLVILTRWVPWRDVPVATALLVAAVASVVALVVSPDALGPLLARDSPLALALLTLGGAAAANAVNNIPALLVAVQSTPGMTWGMWAWLAGVNTGAVLLPLGALANLLWWRIIRDEGIDMSLGRYASAIVPIAIPALVAGAVVLGLERMLIG